MVDQLVTLTYAQILNAVKVFVLTESVSVIQTTSTRETFAYTSVKLSIVEPVAIVCEEFAIVMKVMPILKMFVLTCVKALTVEMVEFVQVVYVAVKKDMSILTIFVKKHVRLILVRNRSNFDNQNAPLGKWYAAYRMPDYINKKKIENHFVPNSIL